MYLLLVKVIVLKDIRILSPCALDVQILQAHLSLLSHLSSPASIRAETKATYEVQSQSQ